MFAVEEPLATGAFTLAVVTTALAGDIRAAAPAATSHGSALK